MKIIFMIVFVFWLTGCSPSVRTITFQKLPPKSDDTQIKIFRVKMPQCNFEEIGIVHSCKRNRFISMEAVVNSLRVEARKMGGDALIDLNETNRIHQINKYGKIIRDPVLSGTVIKFTDPNCRQ